MEKNSRKGLTSEEVAVRQKEGRNVLTQGDKQSLLKVIASQFASPLIILLIVAAVISFATGEVIDAVIIAIVVIANCAIGTVQEVSAEKSVEALKHLSVSTAVVIRDGAEQEISSEELVPGDYVILEAGRVVPADIHLMATSSLKINESALTGESVAVEKDADEASTDKTPLADRKDKAFMSSLVEYGRGEGVVENIGDKTEIGKISGMLHSIKKKETPLQKNLNQISMVLGIAGVILCILMFVCQITIYKGELIETLMISIAFAVAVIPEGLATVVTIVLSAGIKKMSERNAIVKQIHAVETLGAVNVICSDKTGTLTQNRMTVVRWFMDGQEIDVSETDKNDPLFVKILEGFCACNDAKYDLETKEGIGDPTEIAFIKYGKEEFPGYDDLMKKLDRFDEVKSWVTLKKITGNFFVRLLVLACIAAIGFLTHTNQGTEMKLLESNEYAIDWNSARNEYYLYSDLDKVHLKLYLPGKPESIGVDVLDAEGNVINSETYSTDAEPVLEKNGSSYRISGIYEEGQTSILASVYDSGYRDLMK